MKNYIKKKAEQVEDLKRYGARTCLDALATLGILLVAAIQIANSNIANFSIPLTIIIAVALEALCIYEAFNLIVYLLVCKELTGHIL
jgi:hypothetical protein